MGGSDAATRASHVVCFSDRDSGQQRRLRLWKMKPGRLGLVFANPSRPHNSWFRLFRLLPFLLVSFTTPLSLGSHKSAVSSNANILDNTVGYSNSVDCDLSKSEMSRLAEDDQKFLERVQSSIKTVKNWDGDIELLKECRAHIPWDELRNPNGTYSKKEDRMLQGDALFVQRFSRWFQKFMSWVNAPPCKVCGSKECEMKTVRGPESPEEIEAEAKRVEGV